MSAAGVSTEDVGFARRTTMTFVDLQYSNVPKSFLRRHRVSKMVVLVDVCFCFDEDIQKIYSRSIFLHSSSTQETLPVSWHESCGITHMSTIFSTAWRFLCRYVFFIWFTEVPVIVLMPGCACQYNWTFVSAN